MRFLLTNDDGIHAEGLAALRDACQPLGKPLVVAPDRHWSGCGHQVTTNRAIAVRRLDEDRYHAAGSPADCVRIGVTRLLPEADWVLSGINDGANLGVDIYMSGTVAAAREAALLGKPAVALSHYRRRGEVIDWAAAAARVTRVLTQLLQRPMPERSYWNVNLPAGLERERMPPIEYCEVDLNPLPVEFRDDGQGYSYQGDYHQRPQHPGSDVTACFRGCISISLVQLGRDR